MSLKYFSHKIKYIPKKKKKKKAYEFVFVSTRKVKFFFSFLGERIQTKIQQIHVQIFRLQSLFFFFLTFFVFL